MAIELKRDSFVPVSGRPASCGRSRRPTGGQIERRLLNRLRADLIATFPAALDSTGDDMGAPTFLRLVERWPSAESLAGATEELVSFAGTPA